MDKPTGVCPNCGSYDNISLCGEVPLIAVELQCSEFNGEGDTRATVHVEKRGRRRDDSLPPPGKFYCDNCNKYFDQPTFVK